MPKPKKRTWGTVFGPFPTGDPTGKPYAVGARTETRGYQWRFTQQKDAAKLAADLRAGRISHPREVELI